MTHIMMIASDLDGTLINSQRVISQRTKHVLTAAMDRGIVFVPCSGRPLTEIPVWLREQKKIRYIVSNNGATISDNLSGETIIRHTLSTAVLESVLEMSKPYHDVWTLGIDGHLYSSILLKEKLLNGEYDAEYTKYLLKTRQFYTNLDELTGGKDNIIEKIHFGFSDETLENRQAFLEVLQDCKDVNATSSHYSNIEITHLLASKAVAVKSIMEILHVDENSLMAFGDNENDVSMLNMTAYGFAVANGTQACLDAARHTCASNNDDGPAQIIEKYILI